MAKSKSSKRGARQQRRRAEIAEQNARVLAADTSLRGIKETARRESGKRPNLLNRAVPGTACKSAGSTKTTKARASA